MEDSSYDDPPDTPKSHQTPPSTLHNARPRPSRSPSSNPNFSSLPPLVTSQPTRQLGSHRIASYVNKRLSTLSSSSGQIPRSRPQSHVFPAFHSSLSYTLVRDFAYASYHPMHYGPPQEPRSAASTTTSEFARRLSDPPAPQWQSTRGQWPTPVGGDPAMYGGPQLPATAFGDGPPWREDEDLLSPVVTSSKHRKTKSDIVDPDYFSGSGFNPVNSGRRASYAGQNADGSETYYLDQTGETVPDGPGGEFIDVAPSQSQWHASSMNSNYGHRRSYLEPHPTQYPSASPELLGEDEDSRYSRDYSFTIASPDEEMHGKAVALYDFQRENENELPLVEGQVLWVSYRHGQGWLVAQDPKSGESGLVPEEYVRLVRDIQGGLNGLNGQTSGAESPSAGPDTPTLPSAAQERPDSGYSGSANMAQPYVPIISHFSTSSKDLQPYPQRLLGSQATTPTAQLDRQLQGAHAEEEQKSPMVLQIADSEDSSSDDQEEEEEVEEEAEVTQIRRSRQSAESKLPSATR